MCFSFGYVCAPSLFSISTRAEMAEEFRRLTLHYLSRMEARFFFLAVMVPHGVTISSRNQQGD